MPKCDKQVAFITAYATATSVVEGPISGYLLHDWLMGRRSVGRGGGLYGHPIRINLTKWSWILRRDEGILSGDR